MVNTKTVHKIIILLLILLGVISYDRSDFKTTNHPPELTAKENELPPDNFDKKDVPKELLTLNTKPVYRNSQGDIKENLYGKFLNDRAEFYTIKNPKNKIYSSKIKSITLVYLDKNLYKTKYFLASNIAPTLIKKYGELTIIGFDIKNRTIIDSLNKTALQKSTIALNKKIDNYQLYWKLDNLEMIYRVNLRANQPIFELTKRRKDYEIAFRILELSN